MEVIIYWDALFLINLIMNYWILRVLVHKYKLTVSKLRVGLGAILGAGIYLLCLFFPFKTRYAQFLEIIISVSVMSFFLLGKKWKRMFLKVTLFGLFYSFMVAGILRVVFAKWRLFYGGQIHILSVITVGYIVIEGGLIYLSKQKERKRQTLWNVKLKSEKDTVFTTALLDTGNSLIEPISQKPVCLLEHGIFEQLIELDCAFIRAIPYRSVGCEKGVLYGVEVPEVEIIYDGKEILLNKVFCADVHHKLSTNDTYHMILHPKCITKIYEEG